MNKQENFVAELIELQPRLYSFVLSLLANRNDADDVLQQANLVLIRKQSQFEPGTDFSAWARQIAFYEVQTFRKRRARNLVQLSDLVVQQLAQEADSSIFSHEASATRSALRHCLDKLTASRRKLIEQRYAGIKVQELAKQSSTTVGAVSQKLFRIRAALTKCIEFHISKEGKVGSHEL